ncbi:MULTISPECIES: C-GCAxxG-C-C family protein [Psychrilyobacter]|uniref:C_GCAxxG_C_C family protein n=1 Tax=Psychrilyobacter piezotolerans TaxID=2293438 RepID=A0ABX9KIH0_9FUSO|nr:MULTISPECIES: C-GCAxxG-C-C family protein [Psychrilyobacter]MCS5421336.1 C-GCAxxG-C-C family protein [Psychrilyobacter sp. S5]NDI77524.1 C_GCAxxG_C_C family protein [Psychrilyobacter piezotolerans]RDE62963.1 C_GCAxxG_C_C family protein [Psychrilyobacter sp. S5]REI41721.1 C_GCAxxG_C_C family protein [Psychrilyobacter piezotolerans]
MEKKTIENYKCGYNCSQAILKSCSHELEIDEEALIKLSSGLGFGMYTGQTCGAVTAANIIFGLKYGSSDYNDKDSLRKVYKMIKTFETSFKEKNFSLNCGELKKVYKVDCEVLIKTSAEILKELLNK